MKTRTRSRFAVTCITKESRFGIMPREACMADLGSLEEQKEEKREVKEAVDAATSMLSVKLHAGEAPGYGALHGAYEILSSFPARKLEVSATPRSFQSHIG